MQLYVVGFIILSVIITGSFAVCFFLGWNFKTRSFPFVWPIKFVRIAIALLVSTFYISCGPLGGGRVLTAFRTLNYYLASLDCLYKGQEVPILQNWPDLKCWTMPHLPLAVLSIVFIVLFVLFGLLIAHVEFEQEVTSPYLLAAADSRMEVHMFYMKTILAISDSLLSNCAPARRARCAHAPGRCAFQPGSRAYLHHVHHRGNDRAVSVLCAGAGTTCMTPRRQPDDEHAALRVIRDRLMGLNLSNCPFGIVR